MNMRDSDGRLLQLPKLDARLTAIAKMVRVGARCADIGTDHGRLISYLAASGKISKGYACDINLKPLERAAFSLREYQVESVVKLMLSDGLSALQANEVDDFIIAGMGGELIWKIISAVPWSRDTSLKFILCPMTKPDHLRRNIYANGFEIVCEEAVMSSGFPYSVMLTQYVGKKTEIDELFALGGLLLEDSSMAAKMYLQKAARLVEERLNGIQKSKKASDDYIIHCKRLYEALSTYAK